VRDVVSESEIPIVVDADGINALAGHLDILRGKRSPVIMTPHPGEMSRLTGTDTERIQMDRIGIARSFAEEYQVYLVLKGAYTIIADPDGNIYINPTGNPGMATAGSGDVLTGVIAGFIAQWQYDDIISAVNAAVYLHGIAGDMAAAQKGERGMIARDIIENIPEAIKGCCSP
ncbi:MAG: NAD(P)H-hydrate dehydratase, partial [Nitrospirota bacterium]